MRVIRSRLPLPRVAALTQRHEAPMSRPHRDPRLRLLRVKLDAAQHGQFSCRELEVLHESNVYQPPSNGDRHHAYALGRIILVSFPPLWEITVLRRALR